MGAGTARLRARMSWMQPQRAAYGAVYDSGHNIMLHKIRYDQIR